MAGTRRNLWWAGVRGEDGTPVLLELTRGRVLGRFNEVMKAAAEDGEGEMLFGDGVVAVGHLLPEVGVIEDMADFLDHVVGDVSIHGDRLEPEWLDIEHV